MVKFICYNALFGTFFKYFGAVLDAYLTEILLILLFYTVDYEMKRVNPEVLVCTPGRLIDIINTYELSIADVDYFVLDEGDRMLDMGFQDDISEIQSHIHNARCRSMIFSATVPKFIQKLAAQSMQNPVMIDLVGDNEN